MLFFYRFVINLIFLISPLILLVRLIKKKEDIIRFKEKFCFFSSYKKKGKSYLVSWGKCWGDSKYFTNY
jgi:3-deoxy-D-manno-octulosonic-acid transferase